MDRQFGKKGIRQKLGLDAPAPQDASSSMGRVLKDMYKKGSASAGQVGALANAASSSQMSTTDAPTDVKRLASAHATSVRKRPRDEGKTYS